MSLAIRRLSIRGLRLFAGLKHDKRGKSAFSPDVVPKQCFLLFFIEIQIETQVQRVKFSYDTTA